MRKRSVCGMACLLLTGVLAGCGAVGGRQEQTTDRAGAWTESETQSVVLPERIWPEEEKSEEMEMTEAATTKEAVGEIWLWQAKPQPPKKDPLEALLDDPYGDYQEEGGEIAFVADGPVMDGGYNEAIYKGIRMYALAAGISFSYYSTDAAVADMAGGFQEVVRRAVRGGANVIVCSGYDFQEAVGTMQETCPDVSFLLIDGVPLSEDGEHVAIRDNVHCVAFHEEQAGYLAGYMAVLEGYLRFGFIGGREVDSVLRYGYGYLQGIDDAAMEMALTDVEVNYRYAETFQPSEEIREMIQGWFEEGTEIIFVCGGSLYRPAVEAADSTDGRLIGVDMDQNQLSDCFLTSAVKGLDDAVIISLDDYYASGKKWSEEFAGKLTWYGVENHCAGIPTFGTAWRFEHVTMETYYEIYKRMKRGEISVSDKTDVRPSISVAVEYF